MCGSGRGGGGGGRIAVHYATNTFTGSASVNGGTGAGAAGSLGTVKWLHWITLPVDWTVQGDVETGVETVYVLDWPGGDWLALVRLTPAESPESWSLLGRYDIPPIAGDTQWTSVGPTLMTPSHELLFPVSTAGRYFFTPRYTGSTATPHFSIACLSPGTHYVAPMPLGSTRATGSFTVHFQAAGATSQTRVVLHNDTKAVVCEGTISNITATGFDVTFSLSGVDPGALDVWILWPDGEVSIITDGLVITAEAGQVWYVDLDNAGSGDGLSWTTAFQTIQEGIDAAFTAGGGEVWVGEGIYIEQRTHPDGALEMKEGVDLYSGFIGFTGGEGGFETERSQRDWTTHMATINGSVSRSGSAAYHVILGASNATLDGFHVTGGNANNENGSYDWPQDCGGGMCNTSVSGLVVVNCNFYDNYAYVDGGCVFNGSATGITFQNCIFQNSECSDGGGGGMCNQWSSQVAVRECLFDNNVSGIGCGGGMFTLSSSNDTVVNSYFVGNRAAVGGAMAAESTGILLVTNCTTYQNTSTWGQGGALGVRGTGTGTVTNCIFWGDSSPEVTLATGGITYSDIQGGFAGTGNINLEPLFADVAGFNFRLQTGSPCIDTGTATGAPFRDNSNFPRPNDIPGVGSDGINAGFDMGAFEYYAGSEGEGEGGGEGEGAAEGEGEGQGEGEACGTWDDCVTACAGAPNTDTDHDGLTACVEDCLCTDDGTADTDDDGMPDPFELQNGLDPTVDDAAEDTDQDGITNEEEYVLGTAPSNPGSPYNSGVFYVGTNGVDAADHGTLALPWATIGYAMNQVNPGPTGGARIILLSGDYAEDVVLKPGVALSGELEGEARIIGQVTGAAGSVLDHLTLQAGQEVQYLLDMNDAAMRVTEVMFTGIGEETGILVDGAGPLNSVIEQCIFTDLSVGIDIGQEIPAIRRNIFQDISNSAIIVRATLELLSGGSLGDVADAAVGCNTFALSIAGPAVVNERDDTLKMEQNDWGTNDPVAIAARIEGPADFEPFLAMGSGILAGSVYCTVWDANTQDQINTASVEVGTYGPVTQNIRGVYAFPAVPQGVYTTTTEAPGYQLDAQTVNVPSGQSASVLAALVAEAEGEVEEGEGGVEEGQAEGENEGEGETPNDCNCSNPQKTLPTKSELFLGALTVLTLLVSRRFYRMEE